MTVQNKTVLKSYFNTNDIPIEGDFADLVDSIGPRFGVYVAASNASSTAIAQADYVCDGTNDEVQIQAAIDVLTGGGTVLLSEGNFTISATIILDTKVRLMGQGRATKITGSGMTSTLIQLALESTLENMWIAIPNGLTDEAIKCHNLEDLSGLNYHGFILRNLLITGGNAANNYAISITNSFCFLLENLLLRVSSNGIRIASIAGSYNYGNSLINMVEISIPSNRVGWDIYGIDNTKFFNLMSFNYISAVSGNSNGNTGIRIRNCSYMTFNMVDLEGCAVLLDITGAVNGGAAAQCNTFTGIYANGNVHIHGGANSTVFVGGRILGTITDDVVTAGKKTRYLGTVGAAGTQITDNPNGI